MHKPNSVRFLHSLYCVPCLILRVLPFSYYLYLEVKNWDTEALSCLPKKIFEMIGIWAYFTILAIGTIFLSMQQSFYGNSFFF